MLLPNQPDNQLVTYHFLLAIDKISQVERPVTQVTQPMTLRIE